MHMCIVGSYRMAQVLTGENIDEFDKFPTIRQYFLPLTINEFVAIRSEIKLY